MARMKGEQMTVSKRLDTIRAHAAVGNAESAARLLGANLRAAGSDATARRFWSLADELGITPHAAECCTRPAAKAGAR